MGCCADSFPTTFPLPALAVFVRFNFRDEDPDDELDDDFVLVDAPLEECDDVDDEFVLVDALFDARDDLDDRLELFDLPVVVITSVFGSVFAL